MNITTTKGKIMNAVDVETHRVTFLSGGRTDEKWTAQCSCGTRFESTHNCHMRRAVTRHLNKHRKATEDD